MASTISMSAAAVVDNKAAASRQPSPHCVTQLRTFIPRPRPTTTSAAAHCKRNVVGMATGTGTQADVSADVEEDEFVKTVQQAWEKLEDKYAVTSLAVAGVVALWGSTGMLSAIDRLPLIPGVLELVGIGYSGWFAYKNLVFKPDREALVRNIKATYEDIIG